ncbi:MAG: ROK family protein [Fretibacterium sp.]|nr:ROK family protein [Fretibacterium sp.]
MLYGALEAGGTKMVCALGDENGKIQEQVSIPTTTPEETMPKVVDYFKGKPIKALGIACFGPVDLRRESPSYGNILETPKLPWRHYPMVKTMREALNIPIGFDTDVNGSLLGEVTWGCAKGLTDAVYFTIGTGIGAGVMTNGKLLHGMLHPEAGHIKMSLEPGDTYRGHCPSHGACFEGMASGPAIEERWGKPARELADRPEVWTLEAAYIAQALLAVIMVLSPQRIILGGGVMHQAQLFPMIRQKVGALINGYLKTKELDDLDSYIVPASLHDDQGIMGCIRLAINETLSIEKLS